MRKLLRQGLTALERRISGRHYGQFNPPEIAKGILGGERLVAVDVGAAQGLLPHWRLLNGFAQIYQIEPRTDACSDLEAINKREGEQSRRKVICAGVSNVDGPRTLYVSNAPTGSSLMKFDLQEVVDCADYVDPNYLFPITELEINTRSLSSLMEEAGERRVDLIKLDIQGAELEALHGLGAERLGFLLGAEVEVGLHTLYPEEARFPAVDRFMTEQGFELFDVRVARVRRPLAGVDGGYETKVFSVAPNSPTVAARIWEFDAIYFRKKSALLALHDAAAIRRMTIVYCVYNFYSEAHSLVAKAAEQGIINPSDAHNLETLIVRLHRSVAYRFWLADTRIWRTANRVGARLSPRNAARWCQHMYQSYPNG